MELLLIIAALVALAALYFCFGIALKFLVAWWILIIGGPILLALALFFGWVGAVIALIGFFVLVRATNIWSGSELYVRIERRIDKAFYLADT